MPWPNQCPRFPTVACSSSMVASRISSSTCRISVAWASSRLECRSPPSAPGLTSPCSRYSRRQRLAEAALKSNRGITISTGARTRA